MNPWRSVRTVLGSNKVQAHPAHASPFYTHIVSLASLKKKTFWLLCNIIYPCVRVAGPARVLRLFSSSRFLGKTYGKPAVENTIQF
jgi:hypothetical protein